jgi:hypothetical protein
VAAVRLGRIPGDVCTDYVELPISLESFDFRSPTAQPASPMAPTALVSAADCTQSPVGWVYCLALD